MNFKLNLLKIIPLIVLTIGILTPTKLAKAASYSPTTRALTQQEVLKAEKQTGEHQETNRLAQLLVFQKIQQIQFFSFLSLIGFTIYGKLQSKKNKNQQEQTNNIESDIPDLKVITENTKTLNLVVDNSEKFNEREKIKLEDESESEQKAA